MNLIQLKALMKKKGYTPMDKVDKEYDEKFDGAVKKCPQQFNRSVSTQRRP